VRERRGSYNGFRCRLYPFICWIIIKEGPGNFSGGCNPHWVNHVNLCLSCIVCLLCFCFCICFILLLRGPVFLTIYASMKVPNVFPRSLRLSLVKNFVGRLGRHTQIRITIILSLPALNKHDHFFRKSGVDSIF
jgi:hypothetical protein